MSVKQVIVIRKDLKMRRGKECSQASHACVKWLADLVVSFNNNEGNRTSGIHLSDAERQWLTEGFKKVCLQVDSEQELMDIFTAARKAGLQVDLITDSGTTEFNGVPTKTCLAIGPDYSDKIDKITSHLKLY